MADYYKHDYFKEEARKILVDFNFSVLDDDNNFYISSDKQILVTFNDAQATVSKKDTGNEYVVMKDNLSLSKLKKILKGLIF